jgi:hypothetical protein
MNPILRGIGLTSLLLLLGLDTARAEAGAEQPAPVLSWGAMPKDIPDGYMIIEGDIQVPIDYDPRALPWSTDFWPGGSVVYEFDDNVTQANRINMRNAMAEWEAVANVSFHEEGSCGIIHCVHIQNSDHNDSSVGRQFFRQTINIFNWDLRFVMCHELAHTLGFYHEQSRSDRDTYVRINWDQIRPGESNNFNREDGSGRYGPYDFDSVMHYGQFDFAIGNLPTITVLPPNQEWQTAIGQRGHLSQMDQMIMSFIYSYPDWRFVDRNYNGIFQFGTFLEPFRDLVVGVNNTPNGGVLWVQPGAYTARGTFNRPMMWHAPLGNVTLN